MVADKGLACVMLNRSNSTNCYSGMAASIHRRKGSIFSRRQVRAAPVVPSGCDHSQFIQVGETTSSVGSVDRGTRAGHAPWLTSIVRLAMPSVVA